MLQTYCLNCSPVSLLVTVRVSRNADAGIEHPFAGGLVLHAAGHQLYGLLGRFGDAGDLDGVGDKIGGLASCQLLGYLGVGFHDAARNFQC